MPRFWITLGQCSDTKCNSAIDQNYTALHEPHTNLRATKATLYTVSIHATVAMTQPRLYTINNIIHLIMKQHLILATLVAGFLIGASALSAFATGTWTPPSTLPPGNNVDAPINVGTGLQEKLGSLLIDNNFGILGNLIIATGTPDTGKVLTAVDNTGTATWTATSSLGIAGNAGFTSPQLPSCSEGQTIRLLSGTWTCADLPTGSSGGSIAKAYGTTLSTQFIITTPTSMSWTDTGLALTVTPTSASSTFVINAHMVARSGSASGDCLIGLFKNGAALIAPFASTNGDDWDADSVGVSAIDRHASLSPVTYSIKVTGDQAGSKCFINRSYGSAQYHGVSTMTVLETQ